MILARIEKRYSLFKNLSFVVRDLDFVYVRYQLGSLYYYVVNLT